MRVVVPFTHLRPETRAALVRTGCQWEARDVATSDDAYWTLLARLWAAGETFALVEHDVLVRRDSLAELAACIHPWCSFRVDYLAHVAHPGLGCVKFSADLIRRNPDALDVVAEMSDREHPPKHWCRLDTWLQDHVLRDHGERQCVHAPPLGHVRDRPGPIMPTHGCLGL